MESSYWTTGLHINTSAGNRVANVVDGNRLGIAMPGTVDIGHSVSLPYNPTDVNSTTSLEFLLGQQRLAAASGLSFLPYAAPAGTAYTPQAFDASQNIAATNLLPYSTTSQQTIAPGVIYGVPATVATPAAPTSEQSPAHQFKSLAPAVGASSVYKLLPSAFNQNTVLNAVPNVHNNVSMAEASVSVMHSVNSNPLMIQPGKRVSQTTSLADLLDYEHFLPALNKDNNQVQSNSHAAPGPIQPPAQPNLCGARIQQTPQLIGCGHPMQQHVSQPSNLSASTNYLTRPEPNTVQFIPNSQQQRLIRTVAETRPPSTVTNTVNGMPVLVRSQLQTNYEFVQSLLPPISVIQTSTKNLPNETVNLNQQFTNQHSVPVMLAAQPAIDKNLTLWPYMDGFTLALADDPRLVVENPNSVNVGGLTSGSLSVGAETQEAVYEAVSPAAAAAAAGSESMAFNLLDSLQLSTLLGTTVDTSILYASQNTGTQVNAVDASKTLSFVQPPARQPYDAANSKTAPVRDVLAEAVSQSFITDRQTVDELEKSARPKPALGIVLPMTHGRDTSSAVPPSPVGARMSSTVASGLEKSVAAQSFDISNSSSVHTSGDPSFPDKTMTSGSDSHSSGGGIVLTNITGNVYVNQYTMLPGGPQTIDNALLHTDLALFPTANGLVSYEDNLFVAAETCSSLKPSLSVVVNDDELGHLAVDPVAISESAVPSKSAAKIAISQPRKSTEAEFFGADAAPIVAAKPSNQYESSFLKFLCGHKAETLSSVLNSPIRARPELPKYIPEVRRSLCPSDAISAAALDSDITITGIDPPDSENTVTTKDAVIVEAVAKEKSETTMAMQPVIDDAKQASQVSLRQGIPKLPAKFSHKWKNRTSVLLDPPSLPVTGQSGPASTDLNKDSGSSKSTTSNDMTTNISSGKTKNLSNQQWTVSKKSRASSDSGIGLKLVLKAVPPATTRAGSGTSSKRS